MLLRFSLYTIDRVDHVGCSSFRSIISCALGLTSSHPSPIVVLLEDALGAGVSSL